MDTYPGTITVCVVSALTLFFFSWKNRAKPRMRFTLSGIGSLFLLIGAGLATPWLWEFPDQHPETGYLWGLLIFPGVTITLLGSAFGIFDAIRMIQLMPSDDR